MCSIAGVYWIDGRPPDIRMLTESVRQALAKLVRRGPDEAALTNVHESCVLGGNRLIIRGAAGKGTMPFRVDENICYYNGEIYNYGRWKKDAVSDGEAILPAYLTEGVRAFALLDGEFAISIWDSRHECLILARDPFGTKPLYFSLNKKRLLWASSATAINAMDQHPHCQKVASPVLQHTTSVQEPFTSHSGVWMLPPGHMLVAGKAGVRLHCYHSWRERDRTSIDPTRAFAALERSLETRLQYDGVIGIPMSGGIDSGIITFFADRMGVKYHVFSVVKMFGSETPETDTIMRRLDRLRRPSSVSVLECGEGEYGAALNEMFLPDYYDYETFDNGNVPVHTVYHAMRAAGIRVAIDGGGGDELFHGYRFRSDFRSVAGWPRTWSHARQYYSLYTTLLSWTAKTDRAGAHFSIEARYPFQNVPLMEEACRLRIKRQLKWPLRAYLLQRLDYGAPLPLDRNGKMGFSLKNRDGASIIQDLRLAWCRANGLSGIRLPRPRPFPFRIGGTCKGLPSGSNRS